ncbi:MAG: hypothetical protein ACOZQL_36800 [Myxococcota bacterium]
MDELLRLVVQARDDADTFDAIEAARETLTHDEAAALVRASERLTSWPARAALVRLVQDHLLDDARPLMRHFLLHAPPDAPDSELMHLSRAIALCHLERDLDRLEALLDDPAAIEAGRRRWAGAA